MFDKLVETLIQFFDLFFFARIVDEWESGVVLRFGRYSRSVGPGWHLIVPLGVERLVTQDMYPAVAKLAVQSLTTADGFAVAVRALVTWRAQNARKVLLECGGAEEALVDSVTGVVARHVMGVNWRDLVSEEFAAMVTADVTKKAKTWGVKVLAVQLSDVVKCRTYRILDDKHAK
jgi:regulator of protease activity HflC (stomatin/prohibitin superfamily)